MQEKRIVKSIKELLKKIKPLRVFVRAIKYLIGFIRYGFHFGFRIWIIDHVIYKFYDYEAHKWYEDLLQKLYECKERLIMQYLLSHYGHVVDKYTNVSQNSNELPENASFKEVIWTMWWQGLDKLPEQIKLNLCAIKCHSNGHKAIVITKDNYSRYVTLSDDILEKFLQEKISITLLSDIIRMNLLKHWGGIWIDAGNCLVRDLDEDIFNWRFYTSRWKEEFRGCPSRRGWLQSFMGGERQFVLFTCLVELFNEYFKKEKQPIDYFLVEYFILMVYQKNSEFQSVFDMHPVTQKTWKPYVDKLNDKFDKNIYEKMINDCVILRISYKQSYNAYTTDGKLTLYGYLLQKYLKEENFHFIV